VAANLRLAHVRLLDLPSRILLRSQTRTPMDTATIGRALEEALSVAAAVAPAPAPSATAPASAGDDLNFSGT
jgi:hypothetical protein